MGMVNTEGLKRLELFHYRLPLKTPFPSARGQLTCREVLLLKAEFSGRVIWREISPLPGFSREKLEDCIDQLYDYFLSVEKFGYSDFKQTQHLLYPSVSWGLASIFYGYKKEKIKTCKLISRNISGFSDVYGYAPIKVKVGGVDIQEDIERINNLLKLDKFSGNLRLDANQQWSPEEIKELARCVELSRIDWLEDPLDQNYQSDNWLAHTGFPIALDETLITTNRLPKHEKIKALIIKPTILGYGKTLSLSQQARELGYRLVFSSCFESPIGLGFLKGWAFDNAPEEYHGVDTLKIFPEEFQINIVESHLSPLKVLL